MRIVVAHADDEVLGCGVSVYKWASNGDMEDVCIMSAEAKTCAYRPEDNELDDDTHAVLNILGVNKQYEGKYPNNEMNTVPNCTIVAFYIPICQWHTICALESGSMILEMKEETYEPLSDVDILKIA